MRSEASSPLGLLRLLALGLTCFVAGCGDDDEFDRARSGPPHAINPWSIPEVGKPIDMPPRRGPAGSGGRGGSGGTPAVVTPPPASMDAGVAHDDDAGSADVEVETFDPDRVYFMGSLATIQAIMPVLAPDQAVVGLPRTATSLKIRPSDGRLLYMSSSSGTSIREFHCDGCMPGPLQTQPYPATPEANDRSIVTRPCSGVSISYAFTSFLVGPDGRIIHSHSDTWCDEAGIPVATGSPQTPLSVGHANTLLRKDGIWKQASQELVPISGLPDLQRLCVRAREDGYWIAFVVLPNAAELWHVALDGAASREGVYSETQLRPQLQLGAALDGEGRLFQYAREEEVSFADRIIRRSLSGETEVVYEEQIASGMLITTGAFVTGP